MCIMDVKMMWFVFLTFAVVGAVNDELKQALTFELPDNENTCFYQQFHGSKRYIFEYNVLAGGANDVDASVTSPNGKVLYKETKHKSDSFTFESSPGTYSFCFGNEFSTFTHKVVYFSLMPEASKTLAEEGGNDKPTVNTHAEQSLEAIHQAAVSVYSYQTEYRLNEARGRHMAELLNKRVQMWSIIESCIIFLTGVGQVLVLKAFFTLQGTARGAQPSGTVADATI